MNEFGFYLEEGEVKKQKPDSSMAKSLLRDAVERFEKTTMLGIKIFPKIIFENVYDAVRELLDALLALDGYKSYSHEASIAYLKKYGFEDSVIMELDDFRYRRNASKYYGKPVSEPDALEITNFYKKHSNRIITIIKNKLGNNRSEK